MDNWLREFLVQSTTGVLKTAHYPKHYGHFRMKTSFGQGASSRVPWISFLADGMSTSNGYYPVFLFYKDIHMLVLSFCVSETNVFEKTWPAEVLGDSLKISEIIENPPRYGDSWVYKSYQVVGPESAPSLEAAGQIYPWERALKDLDNLLQIYAKSLDEDVVDKSSQISAGLFYMEKQLEDFLIENWDTSELGQRYSLIFEDGNLVSQQFKTSIGPIDILAIDKNSGNHVVIELKRNQTSDDTVGQVARYMGWVRQHLKDTGVRGLIIAGKFDEKLQYAQSMIPEIDVFLYEVQFTLRPHDKS